MRLFDRIKEYGADIKGAMARFVDDIDLYEECLDTFAEDKGFSQLKVMLENGEYVALLDNAHTLKGVAGNLGLNVMSSKCNAIVEKLRNNDYTNIGVLIDVVLDEYDMLYRIIKEG